MRRRVTQPPHIAVPLVLIDRNSAIYDRMLKTMKQFFKVLIAPLLLIFPFSGCNKEHINPAKDISGRWEWLSTYNLYYSDTANFHLTPAKTGIHEELRFSAGHNWAKFQNNIQIESGTYTIGHNIYIPNPTVVPFVYDSVVYYNGSNQLGWDYYKIYNDTLQFCPGFADLFSCYSLPSNGSKFFRKL